MLQRHRILQPVHLLTGMQLYATGDFAGQCVAEYLEQVVQMEPTNDLARYYLVFSLSSSGRSKKALQHARALAERFPGHEQYRAIVQQILESSNSFRSPGPATARPETTVNNPETAVAAPTPKPPENHAKSAKQPNSTGSITHRRRKLCFCIGNS